MQQKISKAIARIYYQESVAISIPMFADRPTFSLGIRDFQRHKPFPLLTLLRATCIEKKKLFDIGSSRCPEAKDPRDKVYALLGLAADREELQDFGFQLDYTHSCQEVYIYVTATVLKQGHMSVLFLNQFPKSQDGLPSWAPDWSMSLNPLIQGAYGDMAHADAEFMASGSLSQTELRFNSAELTVSLSGFVYSKVHEAGPILRRFQAPKFTSCYMFCSTKILS